MAGFYVFAALQLALLYCWFDGADIMRPVLFLPSFIWAIFFHTHALEREWSDFFTLFLPFYLIGVFTTLTVYVCGVSMVLILFWIEITILSVMPIVYLVSTSFRGHETDTLVGMLLLPLQVLAIIVQQADWFLLFIPTWLTAFAVMCAYVCEPETRLVGDHETENRQVGDRERKAFLVGIPFLIMVAQSLNKNDYSMVCAVVLSYLTSLFLWSL